RPAGRTAAVDRVASLLHSAGATPPGADELRAAGLNRQVEGYLLRSGEAERLPGGVLIARPALEAMTQQVRRLLAAHPEGLTVAQLRDRLGTTRRVLVPLLERLEQNRTTVRRGDLHLPNSEKS
ncbi:MAG: SelB C-terminal domain-containing protein, partial [Candidatus Dormiibacterota bacterium]